jgi:DNA adenine methylase
MPTSPIVSKPFLKWAGGKSKLVPLIESHIGSRGRLVEPFVGSGAVFMGTRFDRYLLADSNKDLIALFNVLKQSFAATLTEIERLFQPQFNTESSFYELRKEFNELADLTDAVRKSALFVYLNKHAFNGLCRYNARGQFNVPFGRYEHPVVPARELEAFAAKSDLAQFKCLDYRSTFAQLEPGDVVYCDPPYVPLSKTASFTSYDKGGFGESEQRDLAAHARGAQRRGNLVVISNHDTEFTRELYESAEIVSIDVRRSISSKAATRGNAKEIIAVFKP